MFLTFHQAAVWAVSGFLRPLLCSQVVRAAEEAASTLAGSIHSEQCIKVLCPIVQTADYPINLAAIKMQTKVIERIPKESLVQLLPDIMPGLLQVRSADTHKSFPASAFSHTNLHYRVGQKLQAALGSCTLRRRLGVHRVFETP